MKTIAENEMVVKLNELAAEMCGDQSAWRKLSAQQMLEHAAAMSLKDQVVIVLVDLAGGPVALKVVLKKLADRGVNVSHTTLIKCLTRNPDRFISTEHGYYALNLGTDQGEGENQ